MPTDNGHKILIDKDLDNAKNPLDAERQFSRMGLGMFIHWSVDSAYALGLSHWMPGASQEVIDKYIRNAPKVFNPRGFDPDHWAWLAKVSGMRYAVFTAKHHNGFCMYDTKTTDFNIMNTPFKRDVVKEFAQAMRKQEIVPGLYFSPLDFKWCFENGIPVVFNQLVEFPANNPGLLALDRAQVTELMHNYGDIGIVFFDGPSEGMRELVRRYQPNAVITRGVMKTPEQELTDNVGEGAWEACFTLGESWGYTAAPEKLKSATELIELLIRVRAGGGNLLINVSPDGQGVIPKEQELILTELGLFLFFNDEAIYDVEPWYVRNEKNIWYTKAMDSDTVYAFICRKQLEYAADYANNNIITSYRLNLKGVCASQDSRIEILGQSGKVIEHVHDRPAAVWKQNANGLEITVTRALRPHENSQWPHPVVLRITKAKRPD